MITKQDAEEALVDGFKDALKVRFATIAASALSQTPAQTAEQIRNALRNLKEVHDQASTVVGELFQ